jgi:hypothetical protein
MQESRKYISLSAETILQRAEWDDFATVGLILLLSICYSLRGIVWAKEDPYHHLWFEKPQSSAEYSKSVTTRDISLKLEQDVCEISDLELILVHQADLDTCRTRV